MAKTTWEINDEIAAQRRLGPVGTPSSSYGIHQFEADAAALALKIIQRVSSGRAPHYRYIYGVPRGGLLLARALVHWLQQSEDYGPVEMVDYVKEPDNCLIVDDLVDSGETRRRFDGWDFASLFVKSHTPTDALPEYFQRTAQGWVHFFWEDGAEADISSTVLRQLEYIGEDPLREGLLETPARVVRAWGELFAGYKVDPESVFKTFDSHGYDEVVLLKDVELYSMCEHHMLPFVGRAHIAYIPNGRVIGVSKLARLMEIYSRRLQIQERLGHQITDALMTHLDPKGAACIIEAEHFCMRMRGVGKQNSVMITSSLKGVFLTKPEARAELMQLIRG